MNFGERLRSLRTKKEYSLRKMAEELDISFSALGKYERNEHQPDFDTLEKIADYFEVSIDWLLGRKNLYDGYYDALKIIDDAIEKMNPDAELYIPEAILEDMVRKKVDESKLSVIPVYAEVNGVFELSKSNIVEYEFKYKHEHTEDNFFYLIIPDDSMQGANIVKGSKILIREFKNFNRNRFNNGEIYLVSYNNSVFIRRVFINDLQQITLQSENVQFPPLIIQDISELSFIGEVQTVEFNPNKN